MFFEQNDEQTSGETLSAQNKAQGLTFEISISSPPLSLGSADLKIIESSSSRAEISY